MRRHLLTLVGNDRVGVVESIAETIARHGGNWERSDVTEVDGAFAGVVVLGLEVDRTDDLLADLRAACPGFELSLREVGERARRADDVEVELDLVGNDRPGIVSAVTQTLRDHGITIDRLQSDVVEAPMAGGMLFRARARLRGPEPALGAARADLERLATEMMVDVALTGDAVR